MIEVSGNSPSKQVLKLSSGEYIFKPGNVLTIKNHSEWDIKFLHALGYRITNLDSKSTMVKETHKPATPPEGVTIVEKKPEPKPGSTLSSSELKKEMAERAPMTRVIRDKSEPMKIKLDPKVKSTLEPIGDKYKFKSKIESPTMADRVSPAEPEPDDISLKTTRKIKRRKKI